MNSYDKTFADVQIHNNGRPKSVISVNSRLKAVFLNLPS